jgi:AhpD family alkylhydroperoxidase
MSKRQNIHPPHDRITMTSSYLPTLHAVDVSTANDEQKPLLEQALKQVGFIPNMYANMVNVPAVLSTYLHGYGLFRKASGFQPAEQEVVFLAISQTNGCGYCSAAHSMMADKVSGVPPEVLAAIRAHAPIPDQRLAALYAMVSELVSSHGRPHATTIQAFLNAGFSEHQALYIILAAGVKTLSNYSNHAFATPLDERFAAYALK